MTGLMTFNVLAMLIQARLFKSGEYIGAVTLGVLIAANAGWVGRRLDGALLRYDTFDSVRAGPRVRIGDVRDDRPPGHGDGRRSASSEAAIDVVNGPGFGRVLRRIWSFSDPDPE